tara:strand:+ start:894 stop:1385 length:492 start_codon:yes stop_codon:yes gene_type:complete
LQDRTKPSARTQLEALFARVSLYIEDTATAESPAVGTSYHLGDGLYIISVASKMLSMHPQTLRKYERLGLIRPTRTHGMLRLYSDTDIEHLRMIKYLVDGLGLNLAGVETVLYLVRRLNFLKERFKEYEGGGADSVIAELDAELNSIFQTLAGNSVNITHGNI